MQHKIIQFNITSYNKRWPIRNYETEWNRNNWQELPCAVLYRFVSKPNGALWVRAQLCLRLKMKCKQPLALSIFTCVSSRYSCTSDHHPFIFILIISTCASHNLSGNVNVVCRIRLWIYMAFIKPYALERCIVCKQYEYLHGTRTRLHTHIARRHCIFIVISNWWMNEGNVYVFRRGRCRLLPSFVRFVVVLKCVWWQIHLQTGQINRRTRTWCTGFERSNSIAQHLVT